MGSPARRPPCSTMRRYRPGRPAPANAAGNRGFPDPDPELVAGDPGLADLEDRRPDRPPLADERGAEIEAARREVLAEHARAEAPGHLARPPLEVLGRVGVDGLVRPTVDGPVRLVVAVQVDAAQPNQSLHWRLPDRGPHGTLTERHRPDPAHVDRHQPGRQTPGPCDSSRCRRAHHRGAGDPLGVEPEDRGRDLLELVLDREVARVEPDQLGVRQVTSGRPRRPPDVKKMSSCPQRIERSRAAARVGTLSISG